MMGEKILNFMTFYIVNFNIKVTIILILFLIILGIYLILFLTHFYSKSIDVFLPKEKVPKEFLLAITTVLFVFLISFILSCLLPRPYAYLKEIKPQGHMQEAHMPIAIGFNRPVKQEDLTLHVSPEIKGEWVFTNVFSKDTSLKTQATFYPEESFLPEQKIVVYIVGLTRLLPGGELHEQSLEFFSPDIPNPQSVSPQDNSTDVAIDDDIVITFDAPLLQSVDWEFQIEPIVPFSVEKTNDTTYTLKTKEPFFQDTNYTLTLRRRINTYNTEDFSPIYTSNVETVSTTKFHTVSAPLIDTASPRGTAVKANESIRIVFDSNMDTEQVDTHIQISPSTTGHIVWEDEKTFIFTPEEPLKKDTEYIISLPKGLRNASGGQTEEDIELRFHTLGAVETKSISPRHGAYGVDIYTKQIVIAFNQEVDHNSAEQSFSLTPHIPGAFSWSGNTMTYTLGETLPYSTTYTIHLNAGIKSLYGDNLAHNINTTFTTKNKTFSLDIPLYHQAEDFTCNISATRMVLAYRGVNLSEAQIKSSIGVGGNPDANWVEGYGVHWGPVANYISQYRRVAIKTGWNIAELAHEVEQGNPVIIWWHNNYSGSGAFTLESGATGYKGMHSEVVKGFIGDAKNPISFISNDPWRGVRTHTAQSFLATWNYLGYTAIVVY
ncbi:Ig-like domain-containing protein [Patescibacteria group bacterium]|nr:Ig-like domain-containing protein [Patescibacteria group bacterium]